MHFPWRLVNYTLTRLNSRSESVRIRVYVSYIYYAKFTEIPSRCVTAKLFPPM